MTISNAVSAPVTRPVLARTSSAASGLRFCGIIEEPVVNLSDNLARPVSGEVQITISSASRDKCTAAIEAAASVSMAKSRSDTASSEFAAGRSKPSALAGVGKAAAVARRHFDISEQVMTEGHRLRGLHMGQTRHYRAGMFECLGRE